MKNGSQLNIEHLSILPHFTTTSSVDKVILGVTLQLNNIMFELRGHIYSPSASVPVLHKQMVVTASLTMGSVMNRVSHDMLRDNTVIPTPTRKS